MPGGPSAHGTGIPDTTSMNDLGQRAVLGLAALLLLLFATFLFLVFVYDRSWSAIFAVMRLGLGLAAAFPLRGLLRRLRVVLAILIILAVVLLFVGVLFGLASTFD